MTATATHTSSLQINDKVADVALPQLTGVVTSAPYFHGSDSDLHGVFLAVDVKWDRLGSSISQTAHLVRI